MGLRTHGMCHIMCCVLSGDPGLLYGIKDYPWDVPWEVPWDGLGDDLCIAYNPLDCPGYIIGGNMLHGTYNEYAVP